MADRIETLVIEQSLPGSRLDIFLRDQLPSVSRGVLQRLIEQGCIRVNGQPVKATHTPRAGEVVEITWPEVRPAEALAEDIPLDILFEDAALLVLNKPAGLVVHPAAGHEEHTLVNALIHHCGETLSGIGGVARPGIVHRLDKETSGCLVVAKNDETHVGLSRQFEERTVEKFYDAIVLGGVEDETGEIRASIARHPTHRKRMAVRQDQESRYAHTSYRILERLVRATHVEAAIHTGRTHQIRVHFQFIGHPLLGDTTYGIKANKRFADTTGYDAPRVMLHARKLAFTHPGTGKQMKFTAPLPDDFKAALSFLRV